MMQRFAGFAPATRGFVVFCLLSVAVVATHARPAGMPGKASQAATADKAPSGLILLRAADVVVDLVAAGKRAGR